MAKKGLQLDTQMKIDIEKMLSVKWKFVTVNLFEADVSIMLSSAKNQVHWGFQNIHELGLGNT